MCHPGSSHFFRLMWITTSCFLKILPWFLEPGEFVELLSQLTTGLYICELTDVQGSLTVPCFMHGLPLPIPVEVQYAFLFFYWQMSIPFNVAIQQYIKGESQFVTSNCLINWFHCQFVLWDNDPGHSASWHFVVFHRSVCTNWIILAGAHVKSDTENLTRYMKLGNGKRLFYCFKHIFHFQSLERSSSTNHHFPIKAQGLLF